MPRVGLIQLLAVSCWVLPLAVPLHPQEIPTAATIGSELQTMTLDADRTYQVRDLQIIRGDLRLYLTEGTLSFATPVNGRRIAAIYTVKGAELGDAEVMVLPPNRSERASLAAFTKSPNLDEHFGAALMLFSDDTARELMTQIEQAPIRKAPEMTDQLRTEWDSILRNISSDLQVLVIESLLDNHEPAKGFFYGVIGGRNLATFDIEYQPNSSEPVVVGRVTSDGGPSRFELWTAFRPRRLPPYVPETARISDYRLDTTIDEDLSLRADAKFRFKATVASGRVIPLELSDKLRVSSASIDGQAAEVMERPSIRSSENYQAGAFLLIAAKPLTPGTQYEIQVSYAGKVVQRTADQSYFVDERNTWFPRTDPLLTNFDFLFHCPATLKLVSTGELVSEEVTGGIRTIHRRTQIPEHFAGFNLGEYDLISEEHGLYRLECYANQAGSPEQRLESSGKTILDQTSSLLDEFTKLWRPLPIHTLAVSPIPGYFGQGFPGLIYLSNVAYIPRENRPANLRTPETDAFFSQMLLPHETAHQWWGNIVTASDYRSEWVIEAMANYSALEILQRRKGAAAKDEVLERYRRDLTAEKDGRRLDSAGPVTFGIRLADSADLRTWQAIIYEKGTWIMHMLQERMGDSGFTQFQNKLLQNFAAKPLLNEDLRTTASHFLLPQQPDRSLELFFETWVNGVGVPELILHQKGRVVRVDVSGVDDDFTVDVPLRCKPKGGRAEMVRWTRVSSGKNDFELREGEGVCRLPSPTEFLYVQ